VRAAFGGDCGQSGYLGGGEAAAGFFWVQVHVGWQTGHQYRLRPASSVAATGVPQTRQGWPARL
jgi:hypothetical protein